MSDTVLRISGLKVAYGGQSAARSARPGAGSARPSPSLPSRGGSAQERVEHE
jgi:hypothetical protein